VPAQHRRHRVQGALVEGAVHIRLSDQVEVETPAERERHWYSLGGVHRSQAGTTRCLIVSGHAKLSTCCPSSVLGTCCILPGLLQPGMLHRSGGKLAPRCPPLVQPQGMVLGDTKATLSGQMVCTVTCYAGGLLLNEHITARKHCETSMAQHVPTVAARRPTGGIVCWVVRNRPAKRSRRR
jgi:hypothetical protein